jgi:hypothetical protein
MGLAIHVVIDSHDEVIIHQVKSLLDVLGVMGRSVVGKRPLKFLFLPLDSPAF